MRYTHPVVVFWKKHWHHLLLVAILCAGIWFRFSRLSNTLWFTMGYDESRDMLVARHIVEYRDWLWRGPLAAGSNNQLRNSPVYYYFLALLWFIGRNPLFLAMSWAGILSISIYIAYRVGTAMWDRTLGLIFGSLTAIHPELTHASRHISQPNLLPLWTFIFLLYFSSKEPMTLVRLCVGILILYIPIHFHYGSLLLFPVGLLWLVYRWKHAMPRKRRVLWLFIPAFFLEYLMILWVWLTYAYSPFDQQFFLHSEVANHGAAVFMNSMLAGKLLLQNTMPMFTGIVAIGVMIVFLACALFYQRIYSKRSGKMQYILWLVLFATIPLGIAAFHGSEIQASYVLGLVPIVLLLIAIGMRSILGLNRIIGFLLMGILIMVLFPYTVRYNNVNAVRSQSYYSSFQQISEVIANDYLNNVSPADGGLPPKFRLAVLVGNYLPFDGWGTSALWYFLESAFHMRLIRLADWGVNFYPVVQDPKVMYLLCDDRWKYEDISTDHCVQRFRSVRPYLLPGETLIYTLRRFMVWRFVVDTAYPVSDYNVVYPELMSKGDN